jgi:NTE family protein
VNAHAKILKNHPSFSGLSTRVLNRLTEHSTIEECPKGSTVYEEGAPGDAMYLVLSGRCQSVLLLPGGGYQVLDIFSPGDTFGERALVSQDRHWVTVQVITDSVVLRLDGDDVHRLLDKTPRLAHQLVNRLRDHMRSLGEKADTLRAELGRVVALTCVSPRFHGPTVAENLSLALAQETGRTVLFVRIQVGDRPPRLCEWDPRKADPHGPFAYADRTVDRDGEVSQLGLFVRDQEAACTGIPSLIGHLARHYHYVVISVDPTADAAVVQAFQRQSDLSYILFGQQPADLYRAHLFIGEIRTIIEDTGNQVRPVVCIDPDERCRPFDELDERLGVNVHAVMHARPSPGKAGDTHSHYLERSGDRFSANIRYLAREIGRCRIGLALSSGGAKGFAHVGVLQVLEANGIHVDVMAGASMGAYIASLAAFGLSASDIAALCLAMESRLGLFKVMDPALPPRRGFMKGNKARRLLEKTIGDAHFSDMALQLRIVTTDLETLERVVYDSGQVSPIVQASMAMPGVVVPVQLHGRTLVDGGASDPLPVDVLIEMGVEKIIAVNVIPSPEEMTQRAEMNHEQRHEMTATHLSGLPSLKHYLNYFDEGNILDIFQRSMHAIQTRVAEGSCKQADLVLRPVRCGSKWYDYGNPREYLELGRTVAEKRLPEILDLVRPRGAPMR